MSIERSYTGPGNMRIHVCLHAHTEGITGRWAREKFDDAMPEATWVSRRRKEKTQEAEEEEEATIFSHPPLYLPLDTWNIGGLDYLLHRNVLCSYFDSHAYIKNSSISSHTSSFNFIRLCKCSKFVYHYSGTSMKSHGLQSSQQSIIDTLLNNNRRAFILRLFVCLLFSFFFILLLLLLGLRSVGPPLTSFTTYVNPKDRV